MGMDEASPPHAGRLAIENGAACAHTAQPGPALQAAQSVEPLPAAPMVAFDAGKPRKQAAAAMAAAEGGGTTLSYEVEAAVGGKIAQLGSRIIDGFAKNMAGQFFDKFQLAIEGPPVAEDAPAEEQKKGWFKRLIG